MAKPLQPEKVEKKDKSAAPAIPEFSFNDIITECLSLIVNCSTAKDNRLFARVLRLGVPLRKKFNLKAYREVVTVVFSEEPLVLQCVEKAVQVDTDLEIASSVEAETKEAQKSLAQAIGLTASVPQRTLSDAQVFLTTLGLQILIDSKRYDLALKVANDLVTEKLKGSLKLEDLLQAKMVFYIGRAYELGSSLGELRIFLMKLFRSSSLHHSLMTQAVVMNLLLRNFLQEGLYDQAIKFLEKTTFPESLRSNGQQARYLYYLARVYSVRLDYSEAFSEVSQAIRKAPPEGSSAGRGFRIAANKLSFIIQLLMGDIPDRLSFNQKDIRKELEPYKQMVQVVRSGDLAKFKHIMERYKELFQSDGNLDLVRRLHHNVIRAGLRRIATSYSSISMNDIALKLGLEDAHDTECIVSKAIADGIVDATIDSEAQIVYTKLAIVHTTKEPRKVFHGRIAFCLQLHNEAIKAMQYPEPEKETKIEEAEARRKEHQEQLARAAKDELEGGDDSDLM